MVMKTTMNTTNAASNHVDTNNNDDGRAAIGPAQQEYERYNDNRHKQLQVLMSMGLGIEGCTYSQDFSVPYRFRGWIVPSLRYVQDELERRFKLMDSNNGKCRRRVYRPPRSGLNRSQTIRFLQKYPISDKRDVAFIRTRIQHIRDVVKASARPLHAEEAWEILQREMIAFDERERWEAQQGSSRGEGTNESRKAPTVAGKEEVVPAEPDMALSSPMPVMMVAAEEVTSGPSVLNREISSDVQTALDALLGLQSGRW